MATAEESSNDETPAAESAESTSATSVDDIDWQAVAESCVRVTAAGFAGSLVGLAREKQQSRMMMTPPEMMGSATPPPARQHGSLPRRPPRMPLAAAKNAAGNLPTTWAVSCIMFALILESCRWASPTGKLLEVLDTPTQSFDEQVKVKALSSFGDYTIGGTVAGIAGAMGQRQRMHGSRPFTAFGLTTGLGLGLLAGTLQAAIDVGNMHLKNNKEQQEEQIEQEKQRHEVEKERENSEES